MKIIENRLAKLLGTFFLLILFSALAFCQPALPPIPPDPWLDSYSFVDTTNWTSDYGYPPIAWTNLVSVPEWEGNALLLDTTNSIPAFLNYNIVEPTDGNTNLTFPAGAIACVFICDWASADTNQNGTGPGDAAGDPAYLLAAGDFSSNSPDGLWAIYFDAGGTNIYFGGVSNSTSAVFVSAPISWPSNSVHLVCVSYLTNSTLYLDGQLAATGGPVTIVPDTNVSTNGFNIGSDPFGFEQARGVFWYLELDNSNLLSEFHASYFTNMWPYISDGFTAWQASQNGFGPDFAGPRFPPVPVPEGGSSNNIVINTNYLNYTNFSLSVTNNRTNAYVSVISSLSNLTYQILTNRSLASTNWGVWQVFTATNSITPAPPLALASNAMFFRGALVWSTGTNGLPDWWQMQYFGFLGVNPNGNPAGDGINNSNKYLMGLNPNIAYVSPLIVLPPGGDYVSVPAISIFSLDGATIKYSTDGSTPSSSNGMAIASGVPLTNLPSGSFTLKAWESGLTPNVVVSNIYTIIPGAPVFSLPSGVYVSGTNVSISCATPNAVVRYTTNGTNPTTNSPSIQATNVIKLLTNETINAAAWFNGLVSPVATAAYIIQYPPSNDNFSNATVLSGVSGEAQGTLVASTLEPFEITNATFQDNNEYYFAAGSVWYKWTAPTNGNVIFNIPESGGIYYFPSATNSNPNNLLSVNMNADGHSFTATSNATYYMSEVYEWWETPGPFNITWLYASSMAPVFTPPPGSYYAGQPVILSCPNPSYYIYYTLDGSNPISGSEPAANDSSVISGGSVALYQTATIKAISWYSSVSTITTGTYTISGNTNPTVTASAPVLSPTNTNFATSLTITLTCTNTNSIIFYTLDGSTPSRASAGVPSGGTVTLTNTALFSAAAWATNMKLSPVTTAIYARQGVDTDGDGIPDTAELVTGSNPFVSDANSANPNSFAHGLDNLQVYQNQSVLLADNYSTLGDGIPDWWLVKYGYSVTTSASALGANGLTLASDYAAGSNPNISASGLLPGVLAPVDFHIVAGSSNLPVMVLDNVNSNYVSYILFCTPLDASGNPSGATVLQQMNADAALKVDGQSFGRYFPLPQPLADGTWSFVLNAADTSGNYTKPSTAFTAQEVENEYLFSPPVMYPAYTATTNAWFTNVTYTNNSVLKENVLAQELRASTVFWEDYQSPLGFVHTPFIYSAKVQPVASTNYWGVGQFDSTLAGYQFFYWLNYLGPCSSYYTNFCTTPNSYSECDSGFPGGWDYTPLTVDYDGNGNALDLKMSLTNYEGTDPEIDNGSLFNQFGLKCLSIEVRINSGTPVLLYPGSTMPLPNPGDTVEVAQNLETPVFRTLNYYYEYRTVFFEDGFAENFYVTAPPFGSPTVVPWANWTGGGASSFFYIPVAVTNPVIVAQVGKPVPLQTWRNVRAYRPNGDVITNETYWYGGDIFTTNLNFWIEQDLDQAYLCDPVTGDVPRTSQTNYNGTMKIDTTNAVRTGIVAPDFSSGLGGDNPLRPAQFTPTQAGKVIVTTKPGLDGSYGELVIYVIDLQVDANHDGVMDNRDLTSVNNPDVFWVNNNFDRYVPDVNDGVSYDDDVATNDPTYSPSPGTPGVPTPDYAYLAGNGTNCIPNLRDLEDYTRLWIPGLSNMVANLPTNYGVNLQWRNNTGAAIRLFKASETNGSTNYLFNQSEGLSQLDFDVYPCYGYVSPSQTISLSQAFASTSVPTPSDYFIFCGAAIGNDELVLQVTNQYGGEVGEASVFLNLKDIKQMYERWSVGENPSVTPNNIVTNAGDDGSPSFQYPYDPSIDSTTPYILLVHGWNDQTWQKDRVAECAFKRLYWQGYQGRFGIFRWPTGYGFADIWTLVTNPTEKDNCDLSEYQAWQSATGLLNKLTALNIQYPGQVYMLAHSMGNVVAGEALRLAGTTQVVNTYVTTRAAISAHTYDANTNDVPNYSFYDPPWSLSAETPNIYGNWFATNNGNGAGQIINFYNVNDFALQRSIWQSDQLAKPDTLVLEGSSVWNYYYAGLATDPAPWNNFYKETVLGTEVNFNIVTNLLNRYEVMALAAESYTTALGATPGVHNIVDSIDLTTIWPPDPTGNSYTEHFWHSAEFRGDFWQQQGYWSELLGPDGFDLKSP